MEQGSSPLDIVGDITGQRLIQSFLKMQVPGPSPSESELGSIQPEFENH